MYRGFLGGLARSGADSIRLVSWRTFFSFSKEGGIFGRY